MSAHKNFVLVLVVEVKSSPTYYIYIYNGTRTLAVISVTFIYFHLNAPKRIHGCVYILHRLNRAYFSVDAPTVLYEHAYIYYEKRVHRFLKDVYFSSDTSAKNKRMQSRIWIVELFKMLKGVSKVMHEHASGLDALWWIWFPKRVNRDT